MESIIDRLSVKRKIEKKRTIINSGISGLKLGLYALIICGTFNFLEPRMMKSYEKKEQKHIFEYLMKQDTVQAEKAMLYFLKEHPGYVDKFESFEALQKLKRIALDTDYSSLDGHYDPKDLSDLDNPKNQSRLEKKLNVISENVNAEFVNENIFVDYSQGMIAKKEGNKITSYINGIEKIIRLGDEVYFIKDKKLFRLSSEKDETGNISLSYGEKYNFNSSRNHFLYNINGTNLGLVVNNGNKFLIGDINAKTENAGDILEILTKKFEKFSWHEKTRIVYRSGNKESQSRQAVGDSLSLQMGTNRNNLSKLGSIKPIWSNQRNSGTLCATDYLYNLKIANKNFETVITPKGVFEDFMFLDIDGDKTDEIITSENIAFIKDKIKVYKGKELSYEIKCNSAPKFDYNNRKSIENYRLLLNPAKLKKLIKDKL
ncbi:MAG: hypothetical protein Q7S33_01685 [Nanoarchaeota archaeon]|nr:hypothetical protein [Nanoarchaeota archaeon]